LLTLTLCTHRGSAGEQQDALLFGHRVIQSSHLLHSEQVEVKDLLIAAADGVATSSSAALASRRYLAALATVMAERPADAAGQPMTARDVRAAHQLFCDELTRRRSSCGASTTLVAAHIIGRRVAVLNVGDSRAYRRSASGEVVQISRDHTELNRLRESGIADAGVEYGSIYDALSDCLIADPEETGFAIHCESLELQEGDLLVLCSDGVHDVLGDAAWRVLIAEHATPHALVQQTRERVLAAGAPDNFSIIVVRFEGDHGHSNISTEGQVHAD
jgi:serine/threonine protein phosphatase PrpC